MIHAIKLEAERMHYNFLIHSICIENSLFWVKFSFKVDSSEFFLPQ